MLETPLGTGEYVPQHGLRQQQEHGRGQPIGGRANNGGGRIGEMERDSILSHGLSKFLNESDIFRVQCLLTLGTRLTLILVSNQE